MHRNSPLDISDRIRRIDFWSKAKGSVKDNSALYKVVRIIGGMIEARQSELTHGKINFKAHVYGIKGLIPKSKYETILHAGLEGFEQRLRVLVEYSLAMEATPVFITQPSRRFKFNDEGEVLGLSSPFKRRLSGHEFNGVDYYHILTEMNIVIKKVAATHNLLVIEQTHVRNLTDECFYDFTHTTPVGSEITGRHIAIEFMDFLNK